MCLVTKVVLTGRLKGWSRNWAWSGALALRKERLLQWPHFTVTVSNKRLYGSATCLAVPIFLYTCIYIHTARLRNKIYTNLSQNKYHIYMHIYIYRERERERECAMYIYVPVKLLVPKSSWGLSIKLCTYTSSLFLLSPKNRKNKVTKTHTRTNKDQNFGLFLNKLIQKCWDFLHWYIWTSNYIYIYIYSWLCSGLRLEYTWGIK